MIPRRDVAEILDCQHDWLRREWPAYRARLREIGSSSHPLHNAPARRPPTARRGWRPDWCVVIPALVLLVLALLNSGCAPGPADREPTTQERSRQVVISNEREKWIRNDAVTTFCDHGHRVYVYAEGQRGALAVVPNDPTCAESLR